MTPVQKTIVLYLIICTCFSAKLVGQNLQLTMNGYDKNETGVIDSIGYKKTHLNYQSIKNEIDAMQHQLFKLGYIENDCNQLKKLDDSIFSTQCLLKKKYKTIHIYYYASQIDSKLLNTVSKNVFDTYFVVPFETIEPTLQAINLKISEQGFPFSKLKLSDIDVVDNTYLKAHLKIIATEQKRYISDIIIKGYEKFPKSYLNRFLKIKPQQLFNINTIKSKTEQLKNIRFAREVKPPEVLFSKDSTTLYLYLQKTTSNTFDGFLGFGTNETTNKLQFDGYLNLNLTNNLNYGESFRLLYKTEENDQQTFETSLSLPYLLKSPVGFDVSLRIFKRDSSFSVVNQSAKIHYQVSPKHKIYAGILALQSSNLLNETISTTLFDYTSNYVSVAYQFLKNQLNNPLFPVNSALSIETNFGNRKQTNQKEKQQLVSFDGFKIFNLDDANSIFVRFSGATLQSDTYFENELVRFGGINSIRGFEENSIFASLYGVLNTEYRYQINNELYLHSITDIGYFENKLLNTKEKLYGFGFGFGILTKSGLLKFNYANGKNENTTFKLANSKIHLSLVANF